MATRKRIPIEGIGQDLPSIITAKQLSEISRVALKTIYDWVAKGRLDGCFRKRGKHLLILKDLALDRIFNGADWSNG